MLTPFNAFDVGLLLALAVSALAGWRVGLIRSLASILGYLSAAPLAVAVSSRVSAPGGALAAIEASGGGVGDFGTFLAILLAAGLIIGALLRFAADDLFGRGVHPADRAAGALVGLVRVSMVAIFVIAVFDRLLPDDRQPGLLRYSRLKPVLSLCGRLGLRSLPPELAAQIDRIKKDRRI
jgi:membrane protein required for colicin V production